MKTSLKAVFLVMDGSLHSEDLAVVSLDLREDARTLLKNGLRRAPGHWRLRQSAPLPGSDAAPPAPRSSNRFPRKITRRLPGLRQQDI